MFKEFNQLSDDEKRMFQKERNLRELLETGGLSEKERHELYKEIKTLHDSYTMMRRDFIAIKNLGYDRGTTISLADIYLTALISNNIISNAEAHLQLYNFRTTLV